MDVMGLEIPLRNIDMLTLIYRLEFEFECALIPFIINIDSFEFSFGVHELPLQRSVDIMLFFSEQLLMRLCDR